MEIDNETFISYAGNVYKDFYTNIKCNDEQLKYLKFYIMKNPEFGGVIKFKEWINELIFSNLFDYNFIKNLNYNCNYFDRLLELYINRPFRDEKFYINNFSFFSSLLEVCNPSCDSYEEQVKQSMNYFKKIGIDKITNDYEENVLKFMIDDATLIKYGKIDKYPTCYMDALYLYNKFNNNNRDKCIKMEEFLDFKKNNYSYSGDYYVLKEFKKKLLGNLGEYYFYNQYKNNNNVRFVSKEIGNGAGYDMHINNGDRLENLFEVKTTETFEYGCGDDIIFITQNEYECMEKVAKSNLPAKYFISRLYFQNQKFQERVLKYIGGDTLIGDNCEYNIVEENNKLFAKRRK